MLKHSFTMFDWELVTVSSCSRNSPISIRSGIVFMCAKPTRINILQGYCWCMLLSPSPLCCTDHSPLLKAGCGDDGCWKQIHRKLAMGDPANRANRANDGITGQFQIIFVRYRNLVWSFGVTILDSLSKDHAWTLKAQKRKVKFQPLSEHGHGISWFKLSFFPVPLPQSMARHDFHELASLQFGHVVLVSLQRCSGT